MSDLNRSPRFHLLPWLGVAALLVALPLTAGELYQWKDASGVTHYSDAPPPDGEYKNRVISNTGSAAIASAPADDAPAENTQCTTARGNLALLGAEGPVGIDSDGDGKPDSEMTVEQRNAQQQLAEAAINVHCSTDAAPVAES
ncbi:DUF4124 domain-containing protein [Lysobacter sp. A286]